MIAQIYNLYLKYKPIILYFFFGVATTLVNIVCYYVLFQLLHVGNFVSTISAWFISVLFAFYTNKRYVFESDASDLKCRIKEMLSFFVCRLATGIMDTVIMISAVDIMNWNGLLWKIISNVLVIVINYVASKYLIFRKNRKNHSMTG